MRIQSLTIRNLRAIEHFHVENLSDFVVIAGPNGCGKSTVLDAVRLAKSLYVRDEAKRWFQEFGINLDRPTNFHILFRNPALPCNIECAFLLTNAERDFLHRNAENISFSLNINENVSNRWHVSVTGDSPIVPPDMTPAVAKRVRDASAELTVEIRKSLDERDTFITSIEMTTKPSIDVVPSAVATAAFSCFNPTSLGEIEFHGSRRTYVRESVSNIRLNIGDRSEERRNRFLYDLENKYKNIKTQLGEEYISSLLKRIDPSDAPIQNSIKELFKTFFPGKEFLGVTPNDENALGFPVKLSTGEQHDIDELSSGEKEIVYGYLGIRTATPNNSIVLIDEPELHLNPALVQGLVGFYKSHIADALDSQVWIVTHSDAILRQAVRAPQMAVYHMARPVGDDTQQAIRIDSQDLIEAAVIDLVGDLAAYRPYAKIVLVEGQKETRFDVDVIRRLFPDLAERGNFIPVGNRPMTSGVRVRLIEILSEAGITGRAVSISDGDLGLRRKGIEGQSGHFLWPAYEIENFLLVPPIIRSAAAVLLRNDPFENDGAVVETLRTLAADMIPKLAKDETLSALNQQFIESIAIGGSDSEARRDLVDGI